jgi:hypothetical protein
MAGIVQLESIYAQSTYQILFHANIMQLTSIKEGKCTFLDQIEGNAFIFLIMSWKPWAEEYIIHGAILTKPQVQNTCPPCWSLLKPTLV